jgi:hypothetical protein
MKEKPLDLCGLAERELVLMLAHADHDLRWAAFQELGAIEEKIGGGKPTAF